jgi:hypothetical protein
MSIIKDNPYRAHPSHKSVMIKLRYLSEKIVIAKWKKSPHQLIDDYLELTFLYGECDRMLDTLNEFYGGKP